MNILVTGGAGFIGYHLVNYFLERENVITVYDNFCDYYSPYLKLKNAKDLEKKGAKIIHGDILDKEKMVGIIKTEKIDIIIHLAAQPGVRYSTKNPEKVLRINVEGTANVLSASRESNITKVILTSSSSVFGSAEYLPIDEKHPTKPISIYGMSKLAIEQLVSVYNHLYPDFNILTIRPFTVVGSRQRPDMAINTFVSKILNGEKIIINGDGKQTRDWTHVSNIVEAYYLATTNHKVKNEIFNIGAGTRISVLEVLEVISEITGKKIELEHTIPDKADVLDTFADISKAKRLLNYSPKKTLLHAINDFVNYWESVHYGKLLESKELVSMDLLSPPMKGF